MQQPRFPDIHSERLNCGHKTYFFDIKRNAAHRMYLKISCSQKTENGFEHNRLSISDIDLLEFSHVFKKVLAEFDRIKQMPKKTAKTRNENT